MLTSCADSEKNRRKRRLAQPIFREIRLSRYPDYLGICAASPAAIRSAIVSR
jgi:hypothetical protein